MKRLISLSTFFLVCFFVLLNQSKLASHIQSPPAGYVNDPDPAGALTCATSSCHSGNPIADSTKFSVQMALYSAGTSALTDVISGVTTYQADSVYNMLVRANAVSGRYGFEITVVDAAASPGNMAGAFSLTNTTNTSSSTYQPSGSTVRTYVGHKNASSINTWSFKWTAPSTGKGPLTIYYVGMNSNNNGSQTGDLVYKATKVISENSGQVNGVENIESKLNNLQVFPTVCSDKIELGFDLKKNAPVTAELISLQGQITQTLVSETINSGVYQNSFDLSNLSTGVYLLRLTVGNSNTVKKIIKQ